MLIGEISTAYTKLPIFEIDDDKKNKKNLTDFYAYAECYLGIIYRYLLPNPLTQNLIDELFSEIKVLYSGL